MRLNKLILPVALGIVLSFPSIAAENGEASKTVPKSPNRTPMSMQGQKADMSSEPIWLIIEEEDDFFVIPKKYMKEMQDKPMPCLDKEHHKHKKHKEKWAHSYKSDKSDKKARAKEMMEISKKHKEEFFKHKKKQLKKMSKPEQDWVLEQAYFVIDTLND